MRHARDAYVNSSFMSFSAFIARAFCWIDGICASWLYTLQQSP